MLRRTLVVAISALCLQSCDKNGPIVIVPEVTETFDFETSLSGWEAQAGNLEAPGAVHVIRQTNVAASSGTSSAEFRIDNFNSNARIWLQRVFTLTPGEDYNLTVRLALGSRDGEGMTPWHLIGTAAAGTEIAAPSMTDQGAAHLSSSPTGGVDFDERAFTIRVQAHSETGEVVVALGIWGRTTGERAYYIDNLRLEFLRGTAGSGTPPLANPVN